MRSGACVFIWASVVTMETIWQAMSCAPPRATKSHVHLQRVRLERATVACQHQSTKWIKTKQNKTK
jgi:hypothetical protein